MAEQENDPLDEFRNQWKRELTEGQSQKGESSGNNEEESAASTIFRQAVDLERKYNCVAKIKHDMLRM